MSHNALINMKILISSISLIWLLSLTACSTIRNGFLFSSMFESQLFPNWTAMNYLIPPDRDRRFCDEKTNSYTLNESWGDQQVTIKFAICKLLHSPNNWIVAGHIPKGDNVYFTRMAVEFENGKICEVPKSFLVRLANPLPESVAVMRVHSSSEIGIDFLIAMEGGDGERAWQSGIWISKTSAPQFVPPLIDYARVSHVLNSRRTTPHH